ncbi:von Willebrand factor type A protein [Candidatus Magnetomorum sp. HK-1]|nr:von Willebrand factor type A protein [Candidatus Magnetomorum sp. HK-1]
MTDVTPIQNAFQTIIRFAPEFADTCKDQFKLPHKMSDEQLKLFSRNIEWAGRLDKRFSKILAKGGLCLLNQSENCQLFLQEVRKYGQYGVVQGMTMAKCLYRVILTTEKQFVSVFLEIFETMRCLGPHTLPEPFDLLCGYLNEPDPICAQAYLELLVNAFSHDLNFQDSKLLSKVIPECCDKMHKDRRLYQIQQFKRVVMLYPQWAESFSKGMEKGLNILSESALKKFIDQAIDKYEKHPERGARFLTIEAELAQERYRKLQSVVALTQIIQPLIHYAQARTGLPLQVRPISELNDEDILPMTVCTDGAIVYLPDEMGVFPNKRDNAKVYKCLIRLEAGLCEYHTFDFDLEKTLEHIQKPELAKKQDLITPDPIYFFSTFQQPSMAEDLFNVVEQGRVRVRLSHQYPGMIRHALPLIQKEALRMIKTSGTSSPIFYLYARIALNMTKQQCKIVYNDLDDIITTILNDLTPEISVEQSAVIVYKIFSFIYKWYKNEKIDYKRLSPPFGRKINIKLFYAAHQSMDIRAKVIRQKLGEMDIHIYQSDIRKRLSEKGGILTLRDIRRLYKQRNDKQLEIEDTELEHLFEESDRTPSENTPISNDPSYIYKEWDCLLCDYLPAHTRVYCKDIDTDKQSLYFYQLTLKRYNGLLKRIRRSFEFLRPQGMTFLRRWREGDEFDYRALIDYAVDRKIKITPSDRLYIKHIKQQRDVSVFLLIDLSKSTGYRIPHSHQRVIQVEKEAMILFCEALEKSGDRFAIAAFSGLGRQCVDFFQVKSFESPLSMEIKRRISALSPCRSTRMGAAVRHATVQLLKIPSKVRLLIVLSDGLPNDLNYKADYAISDTRMAIREARAVNVHVHGITVNIQMMESLDTLYGKGRHTIIQDVRDLPDKLPLIYRRLTV